ncbi:MAG: acyltransferase family protein [Eubacterium sp.]|nr:acyltransferase family protein [Eubacterium sp.]
MTQRTTTDKAAEDTGAGAAGSSFGEDISAAGPNAGTGRVIDQFSWIRVIACFAIILLHSLFAGSVYFEGSITEGEILWSGIAENLLMWAVPCFLMVTGALLLDPEKDLPVSRIYGKYLKRVVLALVVFTLIFQVIGYFMEGEQTIIRDWLADLFLGRSWAHMWYLYLMIGIYLMMPFYRMVVKAADPKMLDLLIILIFVFTSVTSVFSALGYVPAFYIPTTIVYPLYVFAGYRLYKRPVAVWPAVLAVLASTAAIILMTYLRYSSEVLIDLAVSEEEAQLDYLFDYYSPLVALQSAGIFSLMCRIPAKADAFLKSLDACTFGIYLIHMIGIHAIMKWAGFDPYSYGPFAFLLIALILFAASFAVTWIIRKIISGRRAV